jgi:hypothetical protein
MSAFSFNSVIDTTKIFSQIIASGVPGPPGPAITSAINIAQTTVDLSSAQTIIDQNIGETFITVQSKPADPQFTYTIQSGDIPVNANVVDYAIILSMGGANTDVVDDGLNFHLTINGVEVADGDVGVSISSSFPYWTIAGLFASKAFVPGDVLGIKMWTNTSNLINFSIAAIYIVPQTLIVPAGFWTVSNGSNYTNAQINGALAGVLYQVGAILVPSFYDSVLDEIIVGSPSEQVTLSTFSLPIQIIHGGVQSSVVLYRTDLNKIASGSAFSDPSLCAIFPQSIIRIIQKYDFVVGAPVALPNPAGHEGEILQVVNGIPTWV